MRMTTLPASAAALAVAGVLLAGCGGDNSVSDAVPSDDAGSETAADEGSDDGDASDGGEGEESSDEAADEEGNDDSSDEEGSGGGSGGAASTPDGWVVIDDDPSGVSFAMPSEVEPQEQQAPTADGGTMDTRSYFVIVDNSAEVGFNVLDLAGGTYDLQAGVDGTAQALSATVESREEITVDGYDAVQAELSVEADDVISLFQLIVVDDFVLQPMVSTTEDNRDNAEQYLEQLTDSLDLG